MINDIVSGGFQGSTNVKSSTAAANSSAAAPAVPAAPAAVEATQPEQQKAASSAQLQEAVSKLNDYVQNIQRTLAFSVDKETGRTIVKVYDSETKELIRQIPPEETVKLAASLDEQTANLFVQERA
jgi:flagellar protein FlaG